MSISALRADMYECLEWQYMRGPCANHKSGKCLEWEQCDLEDRILHDCFTFFVERQFGCRGRWESNLKGQDSGSAGPWAPSFDGAGSVQNHGYYQFYQGK